jgi:hypothetical protein
MKRSSIAVLTLAVCSLHTARASAQAIPNINAPIQAARGQVNKTSAQIRATERAGNEPDKTGPRPAEAAAAAQKTAPQKGAPQSAAKTVAPADTSRNGAATQAGGKGTVTFYRETFTYSDEGRRDPFISLMASDEGGIRPLIVDLSVIGIIYDHTGRNSIATVVDGTTAKVYNIHVGSILGRMKVLKIDESSVTLNLDEFGYSRQETLLLSTPTRAAGRRP